MAARATQASKQEEPNILLEIPYNTKLIIPARLAGEFLPHVRCMEEKYNTTTSAPALACYLRRRCDGNSYTRLAYG